MLISDAKLIQGLIKNMDELAASANDPLAQTLVKSSQAMLLELDRRADFSRTDACYRQGRALVEEAAALDAPRAGELGALLKSLPAALPEHLDAAAADELVDRIRSTITNLLLDSSYPFIDDAALKSVLTRAAQWDLAGYRQVKPDIPEAKPGEMPVIVDRDLLERYLRDHRPGYEDARITDCTPIPGGFSKNTVLFDVQTGSGIEKLVYRGASKVSVLAPMMADIAKEFHVVSHAWANGAAVAEPLWLQSDIAATGTRFFVSRRAQGRNLGTAIAASEDVSPAATTSLARALAKIHCLPLAAPGGTLDQSHIHPPAPGVSLQDVIRQRAKDWQRYWKTVDCGNYPILQLAFQWLYDNAPPAEDDRPVLVHGDYGLHNILIHEDRVAAVLDWEAGFVGDRALDLSHLFNGTAGRMDRDLFMQAYIEAGGKPVSEFRLKYYQVMMNMQFMLCTVEAQKIYQQRAAAGTNYCILGLGFIHYTADRVLNGILDASAARQS